MENWQLFEKPTQTVTTIKKDVNNDMSPAQTLVHRLQRMPEDEDDIREVESCLVSDYQ